MKLTDHTKISFLKSFVRILGFLCLFGVSHHPGIWVAATVLIVAEIISVVEELVI